jgi:trigger factor
MQITREDLNPCTVKLSIVCTPEQVQEGFNRAYKAASKTVRIPGFRPGTAPRHLVEAQVNPQAVAEMAAEEIINKSWKQAADQEKLEAFSSPSVELKKLDKEGGECEYDIRVPLKPVVELSDYKNLPAMRPKIDVTDDEVEAQIQNMRQGKGKRQKVTDRGAEESDVAVINIKVDGEEGDGRTFMVIVGQTFKALDELLKGMEAEDMKKAELTFPANFQEKDWAKKKKDSLVTLRSLSTMSMPELDDEFAQALNTENMGDLRNRLRESILSAKKEQADNYVNEQIMDSLVHASTIHVPDSMWEQVAQQRLNDYARIQQEKGKTVEDLAKDSGQSIEDFVEGIKSESKHFVLRAQAIQEVFNKEGMKIADEDLNTELVALAREYQIPPRELLEALQKNKSIQELVHRAINRKVMNFLNAHAAITETETA